MKIVANYTITEKNDLNPYHYSLHYMENHSGQNGWYFPEHSHSGVFEFMLIYRGFLKQRLNGRQEILESGDLVFIGENDSHELEGHDFAFANLILQTDWWLDFLKKNNLPDLFPHPLQKGSDSKKIKLENSSLNELNSELKEMFIYQKSSWGDLLLQRFIPGMLTKIMDPPHNRHSAQTEIPEWFESLLNRIDHAVPEGVSKTELTRIAGRSREHISRTFRKYLNISPTDYLNNKKLDYAVLMLEKSNRPILDIAYDLGFDSIHHFYRLFKRKYNTSPSRYRKENS